MKPDSSDEDDLYDAARRLTDPSAREAFLDVACSGNPALRQRLQDLLNAAPEADDFFGRQGVDLERLRAGGETVAHHCSERAGEQIGHYRLLQQIGEGGFGTVWMAEQLEPVMRRVALKIVKAGMDTREVIARFAAERQALAMMDHPNIAQVFDAGATDKGRPFFVMELVKGVPITTYCEEAKLGTRERLALFDEVCAAIQHAHQKGIIHRDIKPSNVMVTLLGGKPVVKVIDFGIAKATQGRLTDQTLITRLEQFIGTPAYMSPEQASRTGMDVDTRTDIYALGVLLYELLTGKPPFDAKSLISAGFEEMRRIIREVEPTRPSEMVRRRRTEEGLKGPEGPPRPFRPSGPSLPFPRDLDWIVMKAIEKDRTRRYGTASGFAEDLQRFLAHEPVNARPPGAGYRFRKWVRRNRVTFTASAAVAASLIVGLSLATWMFFKERAARHEADAAGRRVQRQLYASHMNLAKQAWDDAKVNVVLQLLRRHLPQPGEPDLRGFEWYYLERLCRTELLTMKNGERMMASVVFSPDGQWIAGAGFEDTLKVWNAATGEEKFALKGHAAWVNSVAFSRDGTRIASGGGKLGENGDVIIWDAATGQRMQSFTANAGTVRRVDFNHDGTCLATASLNGTEVWDIASGQVLFTLPGHEGGTHGVAFSPDGTRLATAGWDKLVKLWDAANGQPVRTIQGHTNHVLSAAFNLDGTKLVTASDDNTARVWNVATGEEVLAVRGNNKHVFSAVFSKDGTRLASAGDDRTVTLWDAASGKAMRAWKGHTHDIHAVAFSPDGQRVASASHDGSVKVWDTAADQESLAMQGEPWGGYGAVFSPDGKEIASAHWDGTVRIWNAATGEIVRTFAAQPPGGKGDNGWVEAIAYSPDGKRIVSGCDDAPLKIRDAASGAELVILKGHNAKVRCAAWSADGKLVASGGNDFTVRIWNSASGKELFTLKEHTNNVLGVAFSPNGKRLASAATTGDNTIRVWDTATGAEILVLRGHLSGIKGVVWSPDGQQLASAGYDETIRLWDAASGRELQKLTGHSSSVFALAWSPDGQRLASGSSDDGVVKVWDVTRGQETLTLKAHADTVTAVAFSPDGSRLFSVGWDKAVKVWSAARRDDGVQFWREYEAAKAK